MSDYKDADAHLAEIHKRLEGIGMPPTARDWLIKALHPAATHECPGIPDPFEGQIITPDYRDTVVIGPEPGVTGNWDLLVVQLPGDVTGFGYATGPSGTNFYGVTPAGPNVGIGSTVNQPVVAAGEFNSIEGSATGPALGTIKLNQVAAGAWEWRRRYSGITAYMTASALNDQGTVFASSFATKFVRGGPMEGLLQGGLPAVGVTHAWNVPLDETSLQLVSPKPYVAPARHGVYVPARFMDYDMNQVEMVKTSDVVNPSGTSTPVAKYGFLNGDAAPAFGARTGVPCTTQPLLMNGDFTRAWPSAAFNINTVGPPGDQTSQTDSGHSGMTATVIIFRGLANAARITVRSYYGLEMVPTIFSNLRQFCKPAPAYSEVALRTYAAVAHEMAYAYPASYNSFGDILSVIHSVASSLYPPLRSLIGGIPVVGKAITGVGDAVLGYHPAAPHLSEVQRVSTSDPRPPPRPAMVSALSRPALKARNVSVPQQGSSLSSSSCPQCRAGVRHKHRRRRGNSVSTRRSVSSRRARLR